MRADYFWLVIGMGAVTYGQRWAPLFFLAGRPLPCWFREWLELIPAAVLSALILPSLVTAGEPRVLALTQPALWVAFPTFLFALRTRSLAGTVALGMGLYWLVGRLCP